MSAYNYEVNDSDESDGEGSVKPKFVITDIEKLREKTSELLDPQWKDTRNKHLLSKMLDLDEPMITAKMVDFLLQDGVCETLVGFITQVGSTTQRPGPQDTKTDAMKLSYKTASLLSPEDPSEALLAFISKRAGLMARLAFDIFRDDSAGSFYHAHRLLESLLRFFPTEVYDGLCSDGKVTERMAALLRYCGYPIVPDIFVMIVALTPISRLSPLYSQSARSRWAFFEQISQWTMLLRVVEVVIAPSSCFLGGYIDKDLHSAAACQLFQELVEKLSLEDTGELLLQPIGYTAALLDQLVSTTTSASASGEERRNAARLLCFLLRRCAEPEIVCIVGPAAAGAAAQPTCVPNCLYPLRDRVINHLDTKMEDLVEALVHFALPAENTISQNSAPVAYSAYRVEQPFTVMRALLVELVVLMVESDEMMSSYITEDCWSNLIGWTVKYANNNIYHSLFYRLLFAVLRQGQEEPQQLLFAKAKFATFLAEAFLPFTPGDGVSRHMQADDGSIVICAPTSKGAPDALVNRIMARGLVLNCANAVRLQVSSQPPATFLRQFLDSNAKWNQFLPVLIVRTPSPLLPALLLPAFAPPLSNPSSPPIPIAYAIPIPIPIVMPSLMR